MDIEHGVFTPLMFGTNGGMGKECQMFIKQLDTTLAKNQPNICGHLHMDQDTSIN